MRSLTVVLFSVATLMACSQQKGVTSTDTFKKEEVSTQIVEPEPAKPAVAGADVLIETSKGDIYVKLYDETPLHKENFLKLADEGYYDSLLFHRIIRGFMVQGGDPKSKGASQNIRLGSGGPGYTIPAEFNPSLIHKKGALAAARNNNPTKRSSGSQFYMVQGKTYTPEELTKMEIRAKQKDPEFAYTEEQREIYNTLGGVPFLDMDYTVFGEIVQGIDVLDKLAGVITLSGDRPQENQWMVIKTLN